MNVREAHLDHQFDTPLQQREAELLGMWIFLATEVLIFGALFAGYSAYRSWYPRAFEEASGHLNLLIGAINTIVLLTSSLTMAMAVRAARLDQQGLLLGCLVATALLGTAFMVLKGVEYYTDYRDQLVPVLAFNPDEWRKLDVDPQHVQLFLLFYYILTILHAVHLTIGIGLLAWLARRASLGSYHPGHYIPVEATGLYWHFVDIVWIFLLPLLYLTGTHSWHDLHF